MKGTWDEKFYCAYDHKYNYPIHEWYWKTPDGRTLDPHFPRIVFGPDCAEEFELCNKETVEFELRRSCAKAVKHNGKKRAKT